MIRTRLNWSGPASGFSILHWDADLSEAQNAADAATAWWDEINDRFANAQSMRVDPEVHLVDESTGQTIGTTTVTTASVAGTAGAVQVPQPSMVLVRWRTGAFVNGREIRGRTFLPGLSSAEVTSGGEVSANTITDVNNSVTFILADTPDLAVYSPSYATASAVTSGSCWNEFAVMRSRRE